MERSFSLPPSASDAAIYAAAYARHGDRCDGHLLGDYAAVQWHEERGLVRFARSPMSLQPLHVWRDGSRIVAASLPRSLIAAGLEPRIDKIMLEDSILLNFSDSTRSWYQGAHRVAAGSYEVHTAARCRTIRFFSLDNVNPVRFVRDEEYVEALDEHFRRAVAAESAGIRRPAILLSGGFDSQCVASYLASTDQFESPIETFTSVPQPGYSEPEKPYSFGDEAPYVRALADQYPQLNPHFVTGADRPFGSDLAEIMQLGGWPMRNESNLHWIHEACEQAAGLGCDAIFAGAAGNATFSYDGLTGYPTWLREGDLGRLIVELNARRDDPRSLLRKFLGLAVMPHLSASVRDTIQQRRGGDSDPFDSWCPMNAAYAGKSGAMDRALAAGFDPRFPALRSSREWRARAFEEMFNQAAEIELAFRLHHGIPSRDPTLFQPLVEFTAGIADDQYLRDGEDRWLARRLLRGRVPEMVWKERRIGRQSPDWALRFQRDRGALLAELQSLHDDSQIGGILDLDRLEGDLRNWDGCEDMAGRWKQKIHSGVSRALSTARFVRYVERRNVGV
ncbi:asparagine synthase-related protein [Erythrobacter sp. HA6-11]